MLRAAALPPSPSKRRVPGGNLQRGRILDPIILYTEDAIVITVPVLSIKGIRDCPSNPPAEITIELTEPIGDRVLLDGSVYPARRPVPP
jgi:hypothetical protein